MASQKVAPAATPSIITRRHPWDVAIVFDSLAKDACGHTISWDHFEEMPQKCPVCSGAVVLICDKPTTTSPDNKFVLFKYNKQTFLLSLGNAKRKSWWDWRECTAQERMAYALGMNENNGIKVLCKGKVLYPNLNQTSIDISNQLVEISKSDVDNHQGKASLVVMGTRQGHGLHEPKQSLFSIVLGMGVAIVYNIFKLGYGAAMYLFSFVKPLPPPRPEEGRSDE